MINRSEFVRSLGAVLAAPAALTAQSPRPYTVLILGDSIAWGQGLKAKNRWRTLLAGAIEKKSGCKPIVYQDNIHSGAIIGIGDRDQIGVDKLYRPGGVEPSFLTEKNGEIAGEIPSATPTVLAQLDMFDAKAPRGTLVDFVVVSAGINDVDIRRFISPIQDEAAIARLIEAHCRYHLVALLDRIRTRFIEPNADCKVVVLSYFRMLSPESRYFPKITDLILALMTTPHPTKAQEHTTKGIGHKVDGTVALPPDTPASDAFPVPQMIKAAGQFYDLSTRAIDAAVKDANREPFSTSFFHVKPVIKDAHALFVRDGKNARVWQIAFIDKATGAERLQPMDDVMDERNALCEELYLANKNDAAGWNACRIASISHPNVAGAQDAYFAEIWKTVEPFVKERSG